MCHPQSVYSLYQERGEATCHWLVTRESVTPCIPGYPHLHFPGDWYIPPPHTSGPIRGRVEACWPIRGQYVVSRCQACCLCGNTDQGSLLWPAPHPRLGWWNQTFSNGVTFFTIPHSPVYLLLSDICKADWFCCVDDTHKLFLNIAIIKCMIYSLFEKRQMFDAYLPSNVRNILHISFQSNLLVDIHKIDSQYRVFPAAAPDLGTEARGVWAT